ncbi:hypothetical protein M378DRAFT_357272 [Amanita muscaria Koide BX008]|uniref:Uncharacterized protein n=1 Tax=Amanita muscaria (strain Koide BX008) TaxID=946122 RepID=A0A0C2SUZ2_AMAMK|nr:hypothetical protein M378DRAFT_357272 [Amanita muscaria Koide BX008]
MRVQVLFDRKALAELINHGAKQRRLIHPVLASIVPLQKLEQTAETDERVEIPCAHTPGNTTFDTELLQSS